MYKKNIFCKKTFFLIFFAILIILASIFLLINTTSKFKNSKDTIILKNFENTIRLNKNNISEKYFADYSIKDDILLLVSHYLDDKQILIIDMKLYQNTSSNIWESFHEFKIPTTKEYNWGEFLINKVPTEYLIFGFLNKTLSPSTIYLNDIPIENIIKLTDDIYIWYTTSFKNYNNIYID